MVFVLNREWYTETLETSQCEQLYRFGYDLVRCQRKLRSLSLVVSCESRLFFCPLWRRLAKLQLQRINFKQLSSSILVNNCAIFSLVVHFPWQETNFPSHFYKSRLNKVYSVANLSLTTNKSILGNFVTFCTGWQQNKFMLCQKLCERELWKVNHRSMKLSLVNLAYCLVVMRSL